MAFTSAGTKLQENYDSSAVAATLLRFLGPPTVLVVVDAQIRALRDLRWFARVDLDLIEDGVRSVTSTVDPTGWTALARR